MNWTDWKLTILVILAIPMSIGLFVWALVFWDLWKKARKEEKRAHPVKLRPGPYGTILGKDNIKIKETE